MGGTIEMTSDEAAPPPWVETGGVEEVVVAEVVAPSAAEKLSRARTSSIDVRATPFRLASLVVNLGECRTPDRI